MRLVHPACVHVCLHSHGVCRCGVRRTRTDASERSVDVDAARALCVFAACHACEGDACVHVGSRTMTYEASTVLVVDGVKERVESQHARSHGVVCACARCTSVESARAKVSKCGRRNGSAPIALVVEITSNNVFLQQLGR